MSLGEMAPKLRGRTAFSQFAVNPGVSALPNAPAAAAAAGMNTLTFGPDVTLYKNWFPFNFLSVTPKAGQAVQNADGSLFLPGSDGSNFAANVCTAHRAGSSWQGTTFGGGFYLDFLLKFTPTLGAAVLPFPAAWSLDIGFLNGTPLQWPGQPTGFNHRIEFDFMQWPHNSLNFWVGADVIDCFGFGSLTTNTLTGVSITGTAGQFACTAQPNLIVGNFVTIYGTLGGTGSITGYSAVAAGHPYVISATNGSTTFTLTEINGTALVTTAGTLSGLYYSYDNVTLPNQQIGAEIKMGPLSANPFSFANYNRFGFLWTPATASTQGGVLNFLNGVQYIYAAGAPNPVWNQYSSANAPPSVLGTTAGSVLDTLNMALIIGTDATCPMTIAEVRVFQASAASNITQ